MASSSTLKMLGMAAQAGGSYYGQIHAESMRTKRAQEAKDAAADLREQTKLDAIAKRDDTRAYNEGQAEAERERAASALTEQREYNASIVKPSAQEVELDLYITDRDAWEDIYNKTGKGAGGKGGAGGGKETVQQALFKLRYKDSVSALGIMEEIESKYDPTSAQGWWDGMASGAGFTNWMASDDGQAYKAASTKIVEAFLRIATGAAAPEPEQKRYNYMLTPQPGDGVETVKAKRRILRASLKALGEATGLSDVERSDIFTDMVDKAAKDGGFYKGKKGRITSKDKQRSRTLPTDISSIVDIYG